MALFNFARQYEDFYIVGEIFDLSKFLLLLLFFRFICCRSMTPKSGSSHLFHNNFITFIALPLRKIKDISLKFNFIFEIILIF